MMAELPLTRQDIRREGIAGVIREAERHVSRQLRLAYLAPEVLKRLACGREALRVSLYDACFLVGEAWGEQEVKVFF